jgi:hypothetical protein
MKDLEKGDCRQRSLLGRFDDHRVAGGDGRSDFPQNHRRGEVPRCDAGNHSSRPPASYETLIGGIGCKDLPPGAAYLFGIPEEELGPPEDLAFGFGYRFALLEGEDASEFVGLAYDPLIGRSKEGGALIGG